MMNNGLKNDFIKVFDSSNVNIIKQCNTIASTHHVKMGVHFQNCADDSDYIICALINHEVVGFLCLKEYEVFKNSIYIEQIATKKEFLRIYESMSPEMREAMLVLMKRITEEKNK